MIGLAEILLLLLLLGPLIQALGSLAERKKERKEQKAKTPDLRKSYATALAEQEEKLQESEKPVLAEVVEIVYDSDSPVKNKKTPKIRSKSNRRKIAELSDEVPPVSVLAVAEPMVEPVSGPTAVSQPQPNPLAAGIFKMFQSPTGLQQAVLASEILKRRF